MAQQNKVGHGSVRIIAGRWRGRKLSFTDVDGLRPTPDRVRETIFNWLQMTIGEACCLDLFAGSGALGFEAASRGADTVTFVESNKQAVTQLRANCQQLQADNCQVVHQDALAFLRSDHDSQKYDIVFIDPPYSADSWTYIAQLLVQHELIAVGGYIYLECPSKQDMPLLPKQWHLLKDKQAGAVRYCLFINEEREAE